MPSRSQTITGLPTVRDSADRVRLAIPKVTPETNVPVPRVTTRDSSSSSVTSAPLTAPTSSPPASATTIAGATGQPCRALSRATIIAAKVSVDATERS